MSETGELAAAAGSRDPAVGLRAVRALRDLADRLEELQVGNARVKGWSWQEIAACLGVSRQAVHKKYARRGFAERADGVDGTERERG
ncbi:DNA-directed RNA polymerase sigma-70 factor [Kitasatospora sp. MMS16-BH015]|uniref:helix-turn-helix domain-containing protein n=1 Tax=Kitasatospora sp. MMS16-BH015 TaxID=2018025 RepID=UPI000CA2DA46|nr:helix-turn-helix domain-containing protein [Kitasatospora sp. MMS16-BH015]AUG79946.1 DNA-directed RNA polymerase sigma-70 factor [Kitasatospora sp. MMS16-BH015]